ncbi:MULTISPECIES: CoA-binding protein [Alphaproteobacteria]|uniref:CoA-binding protein n=2 Tax=Alphaproteobacteria TaxID=28211 RepID=A0A512HGS8_9HYPH|nr:MULTISPECIES: CoA-binding protein [Alphaproteobacteria]GEO84646.1 CoA-binding protein [Ciceribacter naphthalenivorans]GLR22609.1 CoA-binding protein [Ciceribacter naphthalenivorans]GLT05465.1 CoA-binding protein [Sphingomonas psychrolutea]
MAHDSYSNAYIAQILGRVRTVAVVGASVRDSRPSHWVTGFLLGKGYHVFPVNPDHAGERILGQVVHARLADIPETVDLVDVFRRAEHLAEVVEDVLRLPKMPIAIWGQLGVRDEAAAARAEAAGINVVMDRALVSEYPLVYELTHGNAAGGALPGRGWNAT